MIYNVWDMALYTISRCNANNVPINNKKLQIILYYIQRELVTYNNSSFKADIRAGENGPVVDEIYTRYMGYGDNNLDFKFKGAHVLNFCFGRFVNKVIDYAATLTKDEIKSDILRNGGAWDITRKNSKDFKGDIITLDALKQYG